MSASNAFKIIFTKKHLEELYFSFVRYRAAVGIDRINMKSFERQLKDNIDIIYKKSRNGTYNFSQYREKLLSRGPSKYPRVISIPTIRDKLTLKALFEVMDITYENETPFLHKIINEVTLSVNEGIYDGVLRLDVKDFYPSIQHDILLNQLKKRVRKKEVLQLLKDSISQTTVSKPSGYKKSYQIKGIPQGLSISNILANIYLTSIDNKYSKSSSFKYYRYVDDILILCDCDQTNSLQEEFTKDCSNLGLKLHSDDPEKVVSCNLSEGFSYLGYVFKNSNISVRKDSVENLRESIINIFTNYKYSKSHDLALLQWAINMRITGCIFNDTKYGWLFFFSQINDEGLLHSLDHFIKKQLLRFRIDPKIHIKKFVRVYYEITKNLKNTKYIPNFDLISIKEKRKILKNVFGLKTKMMSRIDIEYQFNKRIYRTIKDLEKDLARIS